MSVELDKCPRNCGGYLYLIGETAGGNLFKCFVCESQVSQPKPKGADKQFKASDVDKAKQAGRAGSGEDTRVLAHPSGKRGEETGSSY